MLGSVGEGSGQHRQMDKKHLTWKLTQRWQPLEFVALCYVRLWQHSRGVATGAFPVGSLLVWAEKHTNG